VWDTRFKDLVEYRSTHGRHPPRKLKGVGQWAAIQRKKYRHGTLSGDRVEQLRDAGFHVANATEQSRQHSSYATDPPKAKPQAELQARILEAVTAGGPVERPKAASEVDFDIEDPPEAFHEPSELVTLESRSNLADCDVVLRKYGTEIDVSIKGNTSFKNLLHDFQPFYVMSPKPKRRAIAKSLVYIAQKVVLFFFATLSIVSFQLLTSTPSFFD